MISHSMYIGTWLCIEVLRHVLSRKMKITRKSDDSLLDIDDITAQISTDRTVGCKSKRAL